MSHAILSNHPGSIVRKEHFIHHKGEFWMPGNLLGEKLGFATPRKGMSELYKRNQSLLSPHEGVLNLWTPSGKQLVRAFTPVGCLLVCMKANTERAEQVQLGIAQIVYHFSKLGAEAEKTTRTARKKVAKAELELFCSRSQTFTIHKIKTVATLKAQGYTNRQLAKRFKSSIRQIIHVRKLYRESQGVFIDLRPEHLKTRSVALNPAMEVMVAGNKKATPQAESGQNEKIEGKK